ncbi:MAG: hypothetical protein KDD21_00900, partial [Bacteroidetes bacterium]|nr:hypothetical protein [Bacteroidota bacterium]
YEGAPNMNIVNGSDEPTTPQPQNQSIINTTKSNTKDYAVDLSNNPSTPQPNNAQDFNTCRGNRERGQLNTNPNDTTTSTNGNSDNNPTNELAKGWDGSVKGNSKGINEAGIKIYEDEPIQGLILKGGIKSGSQNISLTSNSDGVVYLDNLEIGTYTFEMAKPGQPIGGIIVKGGRNPGGQLLIINNDNNTFSFSVSETGNYKIQFSTPNTNSKAIQEAGIK